MPDSLTEAIVQSLKSRNIPELDYSSFTREFAVFSNGVRAVLTKGRLAVDNIGTRQMVVLKTINPDFAKKADINRQRKLLQYFEREAGIWRLTSDHPNILKLYGFVAIPGQIFPSLVSPYFEDGDLRVFVENCSYGSLPGGQRLKLTCDIARGVKFLHNLTPTVVHRDLRASNVLVRQEGRIIAAVLIDFGSAKLSDSNLFSILMSTYSSSKAWTPPEYVLDPSQYTKPTIHGDIWSLACTCIEVFTAKDPYRGYDIDDALKNGQIPDRPHNISDETWVVLKKCFSLTPAQRPRAEKIILDLEALIPYT